MSDNGNGKDSPTCGRFSGEEVGWVRERRLCPYVSEPRRECHCYNLTSQNIMEAIIYCGGSYGNCETYKRLAAEEEPA